MTDSTYGFPEYDPYGLVYLNVGFQVIEGLRRMFNFVGVCIALLGKACHWELTFRF